MVDQLRLYFNRPLRDGDRVRLFAIAVAVIAAGVAVLSLLDDAGPSQTPGHRTPRPRVASTPAAPTSPSTNPAPMDEAAPSEEGLPKAALSVSAADVDAAKRASRTFLADYLAFSYGHHQRRLRHAAPQLARELLAAPPRVPAKERARHPRVRLLQTDGVSSTAASLLALVDDGARSYTLTLGLEHVAGAWTVTKVDG